ncbi:SMI1/KNR4 family protein [Phytomonospora sp. NPDC050363]|uniref:SMI1/KNR4 family protein n=1 Tax=Phytomonospora sp. NPDC050363 TaxID=3155642 RepID=UPI0033D6023C
MSDTPTITESWQRIEAWLSRHAPGSLAKLAPPATDEAIATAEKAIGVEFPAQLVESLRCHDGLKRWGNMFPGQPPLEVRRIVAHWKMCMEINEDLGEDAGEGNANFAEPWWHPLWIPFAEIDGDSQIIDLRPGPDHGRLGWAVHDNGGDFDEAWPDLAAYMHAVAEAYYAGGPVEHSYPYLLGDEVWWSPADTTDVNGKPVTPAPIGVS